MQNMPNLTFFPIKKLQKYNHSHNIIIDTENYSVAVEISNTYKEKTSVTMYVIDNYAMSVIVGSKYFKMPIGTCFSGSRNIIIKLR